MAVLDNIIIGSFTSDGTTKVLDIRCDVDYIFTENLTQASTTATPGRAVKNEYHRGMPANSQVRWLQADGTSSVKIATDNTGLTGAGSNGGFTLINTADQTLGPNVAISTISNASPPVVATASTSGLSNGDMVRVTSVAGAASIVPAWSGIDFTIGSVIANTSFTLAYMVANGSFTSGNWRKVFYNPIYYPRSRIITKVTTGTTTEIFMNVTHGYTVGQRMAFVVPSNFGMTQLNGLRGQITAINTTTNSITVNIDSSSFTAFAWPTAIALMKSSLAQVIPFGDAPATLANTPGNQSVLDGATDNQAILGISLAAGAQSPAGSDGDLIRWVAFKASQIQS